ISKHNPLMYEKHNEHEPEICKDHQEPFALFVEPGSKAWLRLSHLAPIFSVSHLLLRAWTDLTPKPILLHGSPPLLPSRRLTEWQDTVEHVKTQADDRIAPLT